MKNRNSKRQKHKTFNTSRILFTSFCLFLLVIISDQASAGWEQVSDILSHVKAPGFPNRNFKITDYGAVADNETDCTDAFKQAICRRQPPSGVIFHSDQGVQYASQGALIGSDSFSLYNGTTGSPH